VSALYFSFVPLLYVTRSARLLVVLASSGSARAKLLVFCKEKVRSQDCGPSRSFMQHPVTCRASSSPDPWDAAPGRSL
jgi:hypothetical protein